MCRDGLKVADIWIQHRIKIWLLNIWKNLIIWMDFWNNFLSFHKILLIYFLNKIGLWICLMKIRLKERKVFCLNKNHKNLNSKILHKKVRIKIYIKQNSKNNLHNLWLELSNNCKINNLRNRKYSLVIKEFNLNIINLQLLTNKSL